MRSWVDREGGERGLAPARRAGPCWEGAARRWMSGAFRAATSTSSTTGFEYRKKLRGLFESKSLKRKLSGSGTSAYQAYMKTGSFPSSSVFENAGQSVR